MQLKGFSNFNLKFTCIKASETRIAKINDFISIVCLLSFGGIKVPNIFGPLKFICSRIEIFL